MCTSGTFIIVKKKKKLKLSREVPCSLQETNPSMECNSVVLKLQCASKSPEKSLLNQIARATPRFHQV